MIMQSKGEKCKLAQTTGSSAGLAHHYLSSCARDMPTFPRLLVTWSQRVGQTLFYSKASLPRKILLLAAWPSRPKPQILCAFGALRIHDPTLFSAAAAAIWPQLVFCGVCLSCQNTNKRMFKILHETLKQCHTDDRKREADRAELCTEIERRRAAPQRGKKPAHKWEKPHFRTQHATFSS
jgi:hypothetical protein